VFRYSYFIEDIYAPTILSIMEVKPEIKVKLRSARKTGKRPSAAHCHHDKM
jgi:hypothetical protein